MGAKGAMYWMCCDVLGQHGLRTVSVTVQLSSSDKFVVIASDGVWEVLANIAIHIGQQAHQGIATDFKLNKHKPILLNSHSDWG